MKAGSSPGIDRVYRPFPAFLQTKQDDDILKFVFGSINIIAKTTERTNSKEALNG